MKKITGKENSSISPSSQTHSEFWTHIRKLSTISEQHCFFSSLFLDIEEIYRSIMMII